MSGHSYEDDIALLVEDIRRWAGADARITDALEQLVKLHVAEVEALACEVADLHHDLRLVDHVPASTDTWKKHK